jgi:hypothetical protein
METAAQPASAADVTLREHVDAALIIEQFIAEHEGEITPEIEMLMKDHEHATAEKVESIAWFIKTEKARLAGIDAMIADLTKRKQAINNRVNWLKDVYLLDQMHRLGKRAGDALKGTLSTIRLQLNNPRLDGDVPEDVLIDWKLNPERAQFVRYIPESYVLDRAKLLTAGKADPSVLPEGVTIERDESVRVV